MPSIGATTTARAEKYSPFGGYGYFAHGFPGFAEAMAQAVHDFRSLVDYLEFTDVDRIQAVIPNVPVVTPEKTVDDWFPANKLVALSSLNYNPLVPKNRRLIITGLGDRFAFHWCPGNRLLHVSQPDYLRRMTRFMRDFMFE